MEKNPYLSIMIQSLKKKSAVLDAVIELNIRQKEYIRRLTDKSATIQAQEARNKDLMTQKFASVRKQVKEVRKSQKVVNQYYKSMMKSGYMEPQFTDNKK